MSNFNKKPLRITVHKKDIAFSDNGKKEYVKGIDYKALVARKAAIMQSIAERKSEAALSKPSMLVSFRLSSLSSSTRVALSQKSKLEVNKENEKDQSEIIKDEAPSSLKRKRQSDDDTVEENKVKKIEYVTYHNGRGAQGVPKLVIRRIKSHGQ